MRRTARNIEEAIDISQPGGGTVTIRRGVWAVGRAWDDTINVFHYGTLVLTVTDVEAELGRDAWGSVSDQHGVNRALAHLGLPMRASRAGGEFNLYEGGN